MQPDRKCVFLIGFPAVGKSTATEPYRQQGYTIISADDACAGIAQQFGCVNSDQAYAEHRGAIYLELKLSLDEAIERGDNIVFDALNLSVADRAGPLGWLKASPHNYQVEAEIIYPPETEEHARRIIERVFREERWAGANALMHDRWQKKYQPPTLEEGFVAIRKIGKPPVEALMGAML